MRLAQLLSDIHPGAAAVEISGLSLSTQTIQPGELFIALKGHTYDGRTFMFDAVQKGAAAILCEAKGLEAFSPTEISIPVLPLENLHQHLPLLAKRFYGSFSDIEIVGVTGTNGKTTTCYTLSQAYGRLGKPCAILGTIGFGLTHALTPNNLTTPDPITLQKMLKSLKSQDIKLLAMEVSSHGLDQNRVNHLEFSSAMFTNLTQDHLDYHGTMEAYGQAKLKFFKFPHLKRAIVNADSPFFEKVTLAIARDVPTILYSMNSSREKLNYLKRSALDLLFAKNVDFHHKGMTATLETPWGQGVLKSTLVGEFNLSNLLGVLAELCMQGIDFKDALEALNFVQPPPGRMQKLGGAHSPQIIVDYAHTPDALESALKAARIHCQRRLWCVFGCGGDRDKAKRGKMGQVAAQLCDRVVITNDNPRTENPQNIINDILQGLAVEYSDKVIIEPNRADAIRYAIDNALALDTILIAGKGHEDYQIIGQEKIHFSDIEFVKNYLEKDKPA